MNLQKTECLDIFTLTCMSIDVYPHTLFKESHPELYCILLIKGDTQWG